MCSEDHIWNCDVSSAIRSRSTTFSFQAGHQEPSHLYDRLIHPVRIRSTSLRVRTTKNPLVKCLSAIGIFVLCLNMCTSSTVSHCPAAFQIVAASNGFRRAGRGCQNWRCVCSDSPMVLSRIRATGLHRQSAILQPTRAVGGASTAPRTAPLFTHFPLAEPDQATESSRTKLLLIKGLPSSINEEYLRAIFKSYGDVAWVRMATSNSGFVLFTTDAAAEAALSAMNGAEICGTENCTHITVDLAAGSASELVSQRLLSRIQAVKRELRLHQRIDASCANEGSHTLSRPLFSPASLRVPSPVFFPAASNASVRVAAAEGKALESVKLEALESVKLAAQGRALPHVESIEDVNDKFTHFLQGLRSLLPQSKPTVHASISNVSALGLDTSPASVNHIRRRTTESGVSYQFKHKVSNISQNRTKLLSSNRGTAWGVGGRGSGGRQRRGREGRHTLAGRCLEGGDGDNSRASHVGDISRITHRHAARPQPSQSRKAQSGSQSSTLTDDKHLRRRGAGGGRANRGARGLGRHDVGRDDVDGQGLEGQGLEV